MRNNQKSRLARLEKALHPQSAQFIVINGNQEFPNGDTVWQETEEQAIVRHLEKHPENKGKVFAFIRIVFVSPYPYPDTTHA